MATTIILHNLKAVAGGCDCEADTVAQSKITSQNSRSRGQRLLLEAQGYYAAMWRYRKDRERNKRYTYGDQWGDTVSVDGRKMTEEQYILNQGSVPLKTNLIRRLVRSVIGVYRSQSTEPTCVARDRDEQRQAETMSTVLQYNMSLNRMQELYARSIEEYMMSGGVVHRKWFGWRKDKMECWTDNVQPNNFFVDNNMRDPRGWDCTFLGEIHDISIDQVLETFAASPADYAYLADVYRQAQRCRGNVHLWEQFGFGRNSIDADFLTPRDESRCRVIEIWKKETKPRYRCHDYNSGEIYKIEVEDYQDMVVLENQRRLEQGVSSGMVEGDIPFIKAEYFIDSYWYYYYLSPMGDILKEGETPYDHKGHPYVFKFYPFIDGEIHSFVSDFIDQQRYINRLVTLNDWVVRASAKGVLMIPEDCLGGLSPERFADQWTKLNGVIVYKPSSSGHVPQQISANSTNVGLHEMLSMQLKLMEDISGVQGSLQGKPGYSGMSAALYSQQTQNSTVSLLDILDSFNEFVRDAAYMDVKNIQQFYDDKRVYNITGKVGSQIVYDPEKIRDVEFDLSVVPSQSTPAYRALSNEFLLELFRMQAISIEQLLQAGSFPFADELLQSIQSQKEQMEAGQVPSGVSPKLLEQANAGANMDTVAALKNAM